MLCVNICFIVVSFYTCQNLRIYLQILQIYMTVRRLTTLIFSFNDLNLRFTKLVTKKDNKWYYF